MQIIFDKVLDTTKKSDGVNLKVYTMLHHTGSPGYEGNCRILSGKKTVGRNTSVHYVVGLGGEICKIGEHEDILWHAGKSRYRGRERLNNYSIGIEICSDGFNYTQDQRDSVRELITYINEIEGISWQNIIRHKDVARHRGKWDVHDSFWANEFDSFDEYTQSFDTGTVQGLLEGIVRTQKKIFKKGNTEIKLLAASSADKVGEIQQALGLPQTPK